LIARGKYLALAADCNSCHTAPGGAPFAGGAPLKSAFGTLYGANITSDVETGIGSWSRADFERALRVGVRKDGAYLYPAMPYTSYTKLSAADLDALWAYIRTVPAVRNIPPANKLPFPLTIRSGLGVWQSLYFRPGAFAPLPGKSAVWNRGAYLVEALGHCDECHTPRNVAQALEPQHQLTGAQIEGWYAPDISSESLSKLSGRPVDQIAQYLKSGALPGNVKTFGPMQLVISDSLRYLTDSDRRAMAVYLVDQPKGVTPQKPAPVKYARLAAGKRVYDEYCSGCHQGNGKGSIGTVPALAGNDAVTAAEPYNVVMAVLEGFEPQGTWGAMASFAASLSDDQISDVTNYVRTAWGNGAMPNATPWSVGDWRKNVQAPKDESHALLCPNLAEDMIRPALSLGSESLKRASVDRGSMSALVGEYRSAVPAATAGDVIEALSTAYCRAIAEDPISRARMGAQIAEFAQKVATTVRAAGSEAATRQ
jgi:mono/diheme cytochrome c family protein